MRYRKIISCALCCLLLSVTSQEQQGRWSEQKANEWYAKQGWLRGCNFQPSTAINQLEMFQTATFDTATINRELGWAEELGFNAMRVFLHHLLWTAGVNTSGSLIKSTIYRRFYLETSVGYPK